MDKKQIVIFGGCFNPPLNSHFSLAEHMINEFKNIEKVVFVPVNIKYEKRDLVSNEDRYNMLKLVCDKNEKFEVSRMELDYERQLYTIETLEKFQEIYPENEIIFATGSDNLKEFYTWKYALDIIKKFKVYVFKRDNDNIDEIILNDEFLTENKQAFIDIKNNIATNLSSTLIRKMLKENKSIKYLAPEEVIDYIEENKLFN